MGIEIQPWQRAVLNGLVTAKAQGRQHMFAIPARGRVSTTRLKQEIERVLGESRGAAAQPID